MEFRDRMMKRWKRMLFSGVLLIPFWVIILDQNVPSETRVSRQLLLAFDIIALILSGLIIYIIWFYSSVQDFTITDEKINFTNLPMRFLMKHKDRRYEVGYAQIERMVDAGAHMTFKVKGLDEELDIFDRQLDDYDSAKKAILEQLSRRGIPVVQPDS